MLAGIRVSTRLAAGALDRWAREWNGRVLFIRRPGRRGAVGATALVPGRRPAGARVRPDGAVQRRGRARRRRRRPARGCRRRRSARARVRARPARRVLRAPRAAAGRRDWPRNCPSARGSPATSAGAGSPRRWCCCRTGSCSGNVAAARRPGDRRRLRRGPAAGGAGCGAGRRCRRWSRPHSTTPGSRRGRTGSTHCGPSRRARTGRGTWHVRFTAPDVTVVLRERRVDADRGLTCAARTPGWMRVFDLLDGLAAPERAAATH